jgi:hypothetical protein
MPNYLPRATPAPGATRATVTLPPAAPSGHDGVSVHRVATVNPPPVIHPRLLSDLNRRLDWAMRKNDRQARAELPHLLAIADWLASLDATLPTRHVQARAHAAARFLGGPRHA